jgi:hypothetical protein
MLTTSRHDALIFIAAFVSFLLSVGLWFGGQRAEAMFVGLWVPSVLAFGTYVRQAIPARQQVAVDRRGRVGGREDD